jgi:tetratricopeptide (TPR) repeat protein
MVYLAHDNLLDRDVAFALIKTEGLDVIGMTRINREAQAMGRLGSHPHIVTVFDLGDHDGQPFMVTELMGGGDVEGMLEDAAEHRLPLEQAVSIASETCRGLEFAHSKGIVHRDLKPGNVWLTGDGVAKIGDFGLAVASDRSRLTQEGMMVGTVSYMPPEQAMGGEVTQRADLYSLGAMLYEMVTGRPPFLGDDSVSIIGQHINTPPVSPTWHNGNCPRPLEALILRLLAKNPEERPGSASDVLTVLDGLGTEVSLEAPAVVGAETSEGRTNALDSVAQGVFVGRQQEMGELKAALEDTLSGRGRMMTLVGEPGIGKTRTSQELATYAGLRGVKVLWGRCYEEQGVPPYWPWVQAIRSYVRDTEPEKLSTEMGAGAADIAEVVSDVKTQLPGLQPAPQLEPEQARFRLFDSITAFLKSASQSRPLMIILDDLHWADKPSLLLLQFVVRELSNGRILLVGTYRDMELSRQHPLAESLGELTRERAFQRVLLRGLSQEDVGRFIEVAAGVQPEDALVNAVYTQTEGNPLFVTEVVRLLVQEGQLGQAQRTSGRQTESWTVRIPEGVREVIGRRLNRMSERCNDTLTMASIVGREFEFSQVKALVEDLSEDMLLDVLEEALAARVIEEMPDSIGRYQFTHALLQETLMDELSLTRRVRLHARIAESLEAMYGDDVESHAEELVFHFEQAQAILGTEKLVKYSVSAGDAALSTWAIEEGRAHFELARNLLTDDTDGRTKAEVLFGYARARSALPSEGEFQRCLDLMAEAYQAFKSVGDYQGAVSVAAQLTINVIRFSSGADVLLRDSLQHAAENSPEKARILALLGHVTYFQAGSEEEASQALDESLKLANDLNDKPVQALVLAVQSEMSARNLNFDDARSKSDQAINLAAQVGDSNSATLAFETAANLNWTTCDLEADTRLRALKDRLLADGLRLSTDAVEMGPFFANWFRGNSSEVRNYFDHARENNLPFPQTLEALYLLELGEGEKGREQLDNVVHYADAEENPVLGHFVQGMAWGSFLLGTTQYAELARRMLPHAQRSDMYGNTELVTIPMAEAIIAVVLGDEELAAQADEKLREVPQLVSFMHTTSRVKGLVARMIGNGEKARRHFQDAIDFCESRGMKPELAWSYSDMSELVRDIDDDAAASQQLVENALAIANDIGMKPLINRILARREILKA